jgi:putative ABC transport system ATP-binding protein
METDPTVVLRAVALRKRVRDGQLRREVLREISLEVAQGELLLLAGPSGSGKTTLLGLLGGMLLPTSGEVFLGGVALSRLREPARAKLRREQVGYLFQDFALLPGLTVLDNVLVSRVPEGIGQEDERNAEARLRELDLWDRRQAKVDALSGGERQRVALARALLSSPAVLLLDEPTAHLDGPRSVELLDRLVSLAASGSAIVIATHDPRLLDDPRCTRIIHLGAPDTLPEPPGPPPPKSQSSAAP